MLFENGAGFRLKAGRTVGWLDSFLCWNEWGMNGERTGDEWGTNGERTGNERGTNGERMGNERGTNGGRMGNEWGRKSS